VSHTRPVTPWGPISLEEPPPGTPERILDAAMSRFSADGIAATTMSQLAEDVGISRVWLYRYFDNRDAIVRALLGRETRRLMDELSAKIDPSLPITDAVSEAFLYLIERLRGHPLLKRMFVTEPEVLTPFIARGSGPLMQIAVDVSAITLKERAGMSGAEARMVAETLLRLLLSILMNNDTSIDFDDPRQRRAYVRHIIPRLVGSSAR
jgi:AcrR family transcriptional regulator